MPRRTTTGTTAPDTGDPAPRFSPLRISRDAILAMHITPAVPDRSPRDQPLRRPATEDTNRTDDAGAHGRARSEASAGAGPRATAVSPAPDGVAPSTAIYFRVLHIEAASREVVLIDVESPRAYPEWWSFRELERALADGSVEVQAEDRWLADTRPDRELTAASIAVRDERWAVVARLVDQETGAYLDALRAETRGPLVYEAHLATGKAKDKIYRWLRLYWQRGQLENALLPGFHQCGTRKDGLPATIGTKKRGAPSKLARAEGLDGLNVTEAVRVLLVRGGKRYYQRQVEKRRLNLQEAYQHTLEDFFSTRIERQPDGSLRPIIWESEADRARIPTFRQFCYWFGKARRVEQEAKSRWGQRQFNLKLRAVLGSSRHLSKGPGDLYLIDATVADLYLISAINASWVVGRAILYYVIDHFSRMIVGLYTGFEGPSWRGAMMALENAFTDKVAFCAEYGVTITEADWPSHHVPQRLMGDRGEMIGAPSDGLVPGFRLVVMNTPSYRADFKSYVEGQFKITNERGIKRMPGWVNKLKDRGGPDYRLDATLTRRDFTRLAIELALHNNKRRRLGSNLPEGFPIPPGMDPRPLDLWEWGVEEHLGLGRVFDRERVRANLLGRETATALRTGLSVHGGKLLYASETAMREGWFLGGKGRQAKEVELAMDDRDISTAFLLLDGGRTIEVCPLTPAMQHLAGLSLDEVLDQGDRADIAKTRSAPQRAQETADLNAKTDKIKKDAQARRRQQAGDADTPPSTKGMKDARRADRDAIRREEAFTRQQPAGGGPVDPERRRSGGVDDLEADDDDLGIPQ